MSDHHPLKVSDNGDGDILGGTDAAISMERAKEREHREAQQREARREKDRMRQRRRRDRQHWNNEVTRLNRGKKFSEKMIEWTDCNIEPLKKVKPKWNKGWLLCEGGDVNVPAKGGKKKDLVQDAVIVIPDGSSVHARQVVRKSYIKIERPILALVGSSLVFPMTGPCPGGNGNNYSLVKYESDGDHFWVQSEEVKSLPPDNARRNKKCPNRYYPNENHDVESTNALDVVCSGDKIRLNKLYTDSRSALRNEEASSFIVSQAVQHSMEDGTDTEIRDLAIANIEFDLLATDHLEPEENKLWDELIRSLNGTTPFSERSIVWIDCSVEINKKINPRWKRGRLLSKPGDFKVPGKCWKDVAQNAVIVRPEGHNFYARQAIKNGSIKIERPGMALLRPKEGGEWVVHPMTGPCPGNNDVNYSLVKYAWNGEYHWVPTGDLSIISPEGTDGDDRSIDEHRDYLKKGKIPEYEELCGEIFTGYFASLANLARNNTAHGVKLRDLILPDEEGAVLASCRSTDKMQLEPPKKVMKTEKAEPGPSSKKEQKNCQEPGCKTKAHSTTNFQYCCKHRKEPRRKCKECNKRNACRRGGLCRPCFDTGNHKHLCHGCIHRGYANIPFKAGGLCSMCISGGVNDERKCPRCKLNRRANRKGGLCNTCNDKLCNKCQKSKARRKGGLCNRCFNEVEKGNDEM